MSKHCVNALVTRFVLKLKIYILWQNTWPAILDQHLGESEKTAHNEKIIIIMFFHLVVKTLCECLGHAFCVKLRYIYIMTKRVTSHFGPTLRLFNVDDKTISQWIRLFDTVIRYGYSIRLFDVVIQNGYVNWEVNKCDMSDT